MVEGGADDRSALEARLVDLDLAIENTASSTEAGAVVRWARAVREKAAARRSLGDDEAALSLYDEVRERCAGSIDRGLKRQATGAAIDRAAALVDLNSFTEAVTAFVEAHDLAGELEDPELSSRLLDGIARVFYGKVRVLYEAGEFRRVLEATEAWFERFAAKPPDSRLADFVNGQRLAAYALASLGRTDDAITQLAFLAGKYAQNLNAGVCHAVALSLIKRAELLEDLGQIDEAVAAYDEMLSRFGDSPPPELHDAVAVALHNKMALLVRLDELSRAVAVADAIVQRFGSDPPTTRPYIALEAATLRIVAFLRLGQTAQADAAYAELIDLYGHHDDPHVRSKVAVAMAARAERLVGAGHYEDAIAIADDLLARYNAAPDQGLRAHVGGVLVSKAAGLRALFHERDALDVDAEVIEAFADDAIGPWALAHKAAALARVGRTAESLETWDQLLQTPPTESLPRDVTASAMVEKSELLIQLGRYPEALEATGVLARSPGANAQQLAVWARVLELRGKALIGMRQYQEAIDTYDDLLRHLESTDEPKLRRHVALALNFKFAALTYLGKTSLATDIYQQLAVQFGTEALMLLDEQIDRLISAALPQQRDLLAGLLYAKANILQYRGSDDAALGALTQILALDESDSDTNADSLVFASAREMQKTLQEQEANFDP